MDEPIHLPISITNYAENAGMSNISKRLLVRWFPSRNSDRLNNKQIRLNDTAKVLCRHHFAK
jgi:hypothetical protein